VITSSISTNIALSLGMVGALSIVRFRTPIKNPVELLIYFLLIASGIVSYTNINLYVNFIGFCIVAIILIALFKNFSKKSSFISFKDENEEFSFLKLQTNKAVTLDNYSSSLFQTSFDGNSYIYRYRSNNSETLESIITLLEEKDIVSYSIDKSI
jgi:histidyl-tRNA synthetase